MLLHGTSNNSTAPDRQLVPDFEELEICFCSICGAKIENVILGVCNECFYNELNLD